MNDIGKLIELNEKLGIELMTIDVTKYICDAIKKMTDKEFTTFPNREFSFEHDGIIGFDGSGFWNGIGMAMIKRIEFYHDLLYFNNVEHVPTECKFYYQKVEACIDDNIYNNLNN